MSVDRKPEAARAFVKIRAGRRKITRELKVPTTAFWPPADGEIVASVSTSPAEAGEQKRPRLTAAAAVKENEFIA
jgi:hypothetical protein